MGTSLNGLTPSATYTGLLKFGDNSAISASLKAISDGAGNDTILELSTTSLQIGGSTGAFWDNTNKRLGIGTNAPTESLQVQGNVLSGGGAKLVLTGESFALQTIVPSGAGGMVIGTNANIPSFIDILSANQFFHISNRASSNRLGIYSATFVGTTSTYSSELLTLTTGGRLGIGETAPTAQLQVKGSGSTSATTSLLVQNSAGRQIARATDNGLLQVGTADVSSSITQPFAVTATSGNNATMAFYAAGADNAGMDFYRGGQFKFNVGIGGGSDNFGWYNNAFTNYSFYILSDATGRTVFGGATGSASAQVAIDSTTRGFLPPRMTTTQKNAIASPASGLQVYDTTLNQMSYYNGSSWINI